MKYILLVTAFLVAGIGVHARDIFVNGKFVTDRLGKPLLWSDNMGSKASPFGKMTVKKQKKGSIIAIF